MDTLLAAQLYSTHIPLPIKVRISHAYHTCKHTRVCMLTALGFKDPYVYLCISNGIDHVHAYTHGYENNP